MSELINVSICVSDIPRDRIRQSANGKKYINICVSQLHKPDAYENTHCGFMRQTKEERESKTPRAFIGNGRAVQFQTAERVSPEQVEQMPEAADVDDLPF